MLYTGSNVTGDDQVKVSAKPFNPPKGVVRHYGTSQVEKKCVYVVHREDSKEWVEKKLKPIFAELCIDMLTPDDFIPGQTKGQARIDSVKKAQKIMIVFSKQAIEDKCSDDQKWFKHDISRASHKNPDPSNSTVIPVLHGDISCDDLPEILKDKITVKSNDPQLKSKIQQSFDN